MAGLLFTSSLTTSQTIDEGTHLAAGYSYVITGDWRMNPEHPPLAKLLAGLFVAPLSPSLPLDQRSWQDRNQWDFARAFLYHNNRPPEELLLAGRLPIMLITIALALIVWRWTIKHFNHRTGIFALLLIVFEPAILAHGRLVTTDVPLTLTFFLSVIAFGAYCEKPSTWRLALASVTFALAQITKFSALLLIPTLLLLFFINRWQRQQSESAAPAGGKPMIVFILVTALIIFTAYGFQISKPSADPRIVQLYNERERIIGEETLNDQSPLIRSAITIFDPATIIGRGVKHFLESVPVPAFSYWQGLISVIAHDQSGHDAYLFGQQSPIGWWYYFIVAFLVKVPLTLLLLFGAAVVFGLRAWQRTGRTFFKTIDFKWYLLIVPPVVYWLASLLSNINVGVRHLLPVFPFTIIIAAWLAATLWQKKSLLTRGLIIVLIGFQMVSVLASHPHYLAYFNELVGGPMQGHSILLDSNLDWGQDLRLLADYCKERGITSPRLAYFGSAEVSYYLPHAKPVPTSQVVKTMGLPDDVIAISAGILYHPRLDFDWLKEYQPSARIGYSIYVYDFRPPHQSPSAKHK